MVSAVQITHIFNGDNSASDFVDAALLDTQFANLANTLNQEIATRQISISDQGRINNSIVRYTSLHPEVIAALQGIIPGQDVQAVAQTNIAALTGTPIIDGYQTVIGDRVLLVGQTAQVQNGIYVVAAGAWSIAYDSVVAFVQYQCWSVLNGASGAGTTWMVYTLGTTGSVASTFIPILGFASLLPITRGGTGANSAAQALINLGISALLANALLSAVNVVALKLVAAPVANSIYMTDGYSTAGDGGSGMYFWNAADARADNGGSILQLTAGGVGRFNLISPGFLNVMQWGATGGGVVDDTAACQAALTAVASGGAVYFPPGIYNISTPLAMATGVKIFGAGETSTTIQKTTTGTGTSGTIQAPNRTGAYQDNYAVNSIINVVHPASGYAYNWHIQEMTLLAKAGVSVTYGIFAPRNAECTIEKVVVQNAITGWYTHDTFMAKFDRLVVAAASTGFQHADDGSGNGTGTSCSYISCWAVANNAVNPPLVGWNIFGLAYSTLLSCASDSHINASTIPYNYDFSSAHTVTMISCGCESTNGIVFFNTNSQIVVIGMNASSLTGQSIGTTGTLWCDAGSNTQFIGCTFAATTAPGNVLNAVIDNGAIVSFYEGTFPSGGNAFISYTGGAVLTQTLNGVQKVYPTNGGPGATKQFIKITQLVNVNSANTDVATITGLPSKYRVIRFTGYDASISLTTATLSLFTGAGGTGTALVSAQSLAALTSAPVYSDITLAAAATGQYQTATTLYIRNVVAQGAAATASFLLEVEDLS